MIVLLNGAVPLPLFTNIEFASTQPDPFIKHVNLFIVRSGVKHPDPFNKQVRFAVVTGWGQI